MDDISIIDINPLNVDEYGTYCIKDKKSPGFKAKALWFKNQYELGLRIKMAIDKNQKQVGFIEFIDAEYAWRPIIAENYLFINCIGVFAKEFRERQTGHLLIKSCEEEAKLNKKNGICVMTSDGSWIAKKSIFEKNDYIMSQKIERFELMYKSYNTKFPKPTFINWINKQSEYQGWNLLYADQCPWHYKAAVELKYVADNHNIDLKIIKIENSQQAQNGPSGFATFSLLYNGQLLEDHYISKTRFENIIRNLNK